MPVRSSFIIAERALLIRPQRLEQQIGFLRRDPPIGDHAQNGGALIFARRTRRWRSLLRRRRLRRFIGGRRGIGRVRDIDPDRCAGRRFGRVRWFRRMGRVRRTGRVWRSGWMGWMGRVRWMRRMGSRDAQTFESAFDRFDCANDSRLGSGCRFALHAFQTFFIKPPLAIIDAHMHSARMPLALCTLAGAFRRLAHVALDPLTQTLSLALRAARPLVATSPPFPG
jgi:hypothetical protein